MEMDKKLLDFLRAKHTEIGKELFFVEPKLHNTYTTEQVFYESKDGRITISFAFKGAYMGWIMLRYGQQDHILFYDFFSFVIYLEWNKRNERTPKEIMSYVEKYKEEYAKEGVSTSPTEPSDLQSYVSQRNQMDIIEGGYRYQIPDLVKVDEKNIEKEEFTERTIHQILDKLYEGAYGRIEVTFHHTEEVRKSKNSFILSSMESLIFLCEDGKALVRYFSDEHKYMGIFFENRNGANMIPMDKLPRTTIRNQEVYEQNVVLDRSILGGLFLEMVRDRRIYYDATGRAWRKEGSFSGRTFANKNAYTKQRTEKGEFQ